MTGVQIESYEDLGRYLRDVRESLRLDLPQVAHDLNIRMKYLEALENGSMALLPGKIYARGYLLQYAEYLGLEKQDALGAYDQLDSPQKAKYFVPEPTSRSFQPSMKALVGSILVLLVMYSYWYVTDDTTLPEETKDVIPPVPQHLLVDSMVQQPVVETEMTGMDASVAIKADVTPQSTPQAIQIPAAVSEAEALSDLAPSASGAKVPAPVAKPEHEVDADAEKVALPWLKKAETPKQGEQQEAEEPTKAAQ